MYGTRFAMIQRSAPDWSIRPEVVVVKPRNRPNSTTISTTANTIPVRVTANRTLSWTRFRQASIDMCAADRAAVRLYAVRLYNA